MFDLLLQLPGLVFQLGTLLNFQISLCYTFVHTDSQRHALLLQIFLISLRVKACFQFTASNQIPLSGCACESMVLTLRKVELLKENALKCI